MNKSKIRAERKTRFNESRQFSLGDLIEKLEEIDDLNSKDVRFDFAYFAPSTFHSWRGAYEELAVSYSEDTKNAGVFLDECRNTIGKTFTGWKGGEFTMSSETPVWVALAGMSCNTVIIAVSDHDSMVILHTAYMEY